MTLAIIYLNLTFPNNNLSTISSILWNKCWSPYVGIGAEQSKNHFTWSRLPLFLECYSSFLWLDLSCFKVCLKSSLVCELLNCGNLFFLAVLFLMTYLVNNQALFCFWWVDGRGNFFDVIASLQKSFKIGIRNSLIPFIQIHQLLYILPHLFYHCLHIHVYRVKIIFKCHHIFSTIWEFIYQNLFSLE